MSQVPTSTVERPGTSSLDFARTKAGSARVNDIGTQYVNTFTEGRGEREKVAEARSAYQLRTKVRVCQEGRSCKGGWERLAGGNRQGLEHTGPQAGEVGATSRSGRGTKGWTHSTEDAA